jgi:hypothetical protein
MSYRALLATTSFEQVAGSEILLLELAEALQQNGFACELTAHDLNQPMRRLAAKAGVTFVPKPSAARPLSYDLVWLQTQIGATMDFSPGPDVRPRTFMAFAHLDLRWDLAGPGVVLEELAADAFMFPSPEAAAHFGARGLSGTRAHVFHNAAPASFARPAFRPRQALRRILLVSNHLPAELAEAASLLRAEGVDVSHWGRHGDVRNTRLLPQHLDEADAVVSIGKTVQYALRARVPVYVYDHLGGPGWLRADNFAACAFANFSGRCCGRRLEAPDLVGEILTGFAEAAQSAAARTEAELHPYALETQIRLLLEAQARAIPSKERLARLAGASESLRRERDLARAAGHYFNAWRIAQRKLAALTET